MWTDSDCCCFGGWLAGTLEGDHWPALDSTRSAISFTILIQNAELQLGIFMSLVCYAFLCLWSVCSWQRNTKKVEMGATNIYPFVSDPLLLNVTFVLCQSNHFLHAFITYHFICMICISLLGCCLQNSARGVLFCHSDQHYQCFWQVWRDFSSRLPTII